MGKGNTVYNIRKTKRENKEKQKNKSTSTKEKSKLIRLSGDFTKLSITTRKGIDKEWAFPHSSFGGETPVGICHYSKHPGLLSAADVEEQGCIEKGCKMLVKTDKEFWAGKEESRQQEIEGKKRALADKNNAEKPNEASEEYFIKLLEKITFESTYKSEGENQGITITKENRAQLSDEELNSIIGRAQKKMASPADLDNANLAIKEKRRRENERNRIKNLEKKRLKERKTKEKEEEDNNKSYVESVISNEMEYLYPARSISTINKKAKHTAYKAKKRKFYKSGQVKDPIYIRKKSDEKCRARKNEVRERLREYDEYKEFFSSDFI